VNVTIFLLYIMVPINSNAFVIGDEDHFSVAFAQEQEIPPIAPSVPQTPSPLIPTPQDSPFINDSTNITNETTDVQTPDREQLPANMTSTPVPEESQFVTYQNSSFGSVQYPSNWETLELGDGSVVFHSPLPANESVYSESDGFLSLDT
jgi:hypothetical protein